MAYRTIIHNNAPNEALIQKVLASLNAAWKTYQDNRGNDIARLMVQDIVHYQGCLSNYGVKYYQDEKTGKWKLRRTEQSPSK